MILTDNKHVYSWCRDCIDLVFSLAYPAKDHCYYYDSGKEDEEMLDKIEAEMFPLLGWMKNLKSLTVLRNGKSYLYKGICFVMRLLDWLSPQLKSLERLHVPKEYDYVVGSSPFLKSITATHSTNVWRDERMANNLEHIGDICFHDFIHSYHFLHPHLKYVRGFCDSDDEVGIHYLFKHFLKRLLTYYIANF